MTSPMSTFPLVIVSCTDRKSLPIKSKLQTRSIPKNLNLEDAATRWVNAVKAEYSCGNSIPLRDLYQGEYWRLVRQVETKAQVRVVSAGLGIHTLDDLGIGYAATFTSGVLDSVNRWGSDTNGDTEVEWWSKLHSKNSVGVWNWVEKFIGSKKSSMVLVAVSGPYQNALSSDLIKLAMNGLVVVVVSGSEIPNILDGVSNIHHVRVTQKLRMILSGSTPTIAIRFVYELLETGNWQSPTSIHRHLDFLESKYAKLPTYKKLPSLNRTPMGSDDDVRKWIRKILKLGEIVNPTKSRLLRILRDKENRGCEQKRFGKLFDEVFEDFGLTQ